MVKFDLFDLRKKSYKFMMDKQRRASGVGRRAAGVGRQASGAGAEILALPAIVGDECTALRIQSDFADLKAKFCAAVKPPSGLGGVCGSLQFICGGHGSC